MGRGGVSRFQPGDEVFGWCRAAFAELVAAPQDALAHKPANLEPEEAAAVPISAFTALQALRDKGRVKAGQNVLILGASGGVGTFAVQLAKAFGAKVIGVCSSAGADLVRSLGADVIDYTRDHFADGGRRYDLIIDVVGASSLSVCRRALRRTGTLVMVGGSGGRLFNGTDRWIRGLALSPFVDRGCGL